MLFYGGKEMGSGIISRMKWVKTFFGNSSKGTECKYGYNGDKYRCKFKSVLLI